MSFLAGHVYVLCSFMTHRYSPLERGHARDAVGAYQHGRVLVEQWAAPPLVVPSLLVFCVRSSKQQAAISVWCVRTDLCIGQRGLSLTRVFSVLQTRSRSDGGYAASLASCIGRRRFA